MKQSKQKLWLSVAGVALAVLFAIRLDLIPGPTKPPETRFIGKWNIDPLKTLSKAETDRKVVQQNYAAVGKYLVQFGYQFTDSGVLKYGRSQRYRTIGTYQVLDVSDGKVLLNFNYTDAREGRSEKIALSYASGDLIMTRGKHTTVLGR